MLCFILGKDGVCFGSADCKYGYNCEHPICDTAHHHCLCGRKIRPQNINWQDWKYTSFSIFIRHSQNMRRHNGKD